MMKKLMYIFLTLTVFTGLNMTVYAMEAERIADNSNERLSSEQLRSLSNQELNELYAPFREMVELLGAAYNIDIKPPTAYDGYGREAIIRILAYMNMTGSFPFLQMNNSGA